ncbi:MAG: helix-turn-helix transcriptional regulator [Sphingomonas sp.]|nr:helix-turn-helix transcriptional regulator [Sphingomonas sp.]MDX3883588.1 helix-turn-helix transcriptional regulator [Sphingomonas sp.]
MKLGDWRRERGLTQQAVADELGCVISTVARWETGARVPEEDALKAIYILTDGAVQPNDFHDIPAWEAERIANAAKAELAARRAA